MKRLIKPLETKKKKSQPREKVIQSHILAWLRSVGCSVDIITVSMYNSSCISDIPPLLYAFSVITSQLIPLERNHATMLACIIFSDCTLRLRFVNGLMNWFTI